MLGCSGRANDHYTYHGYHHDDGYHDNGHHGSGDHSRHHDNPRHNHDYFLRCPYLHRHSRQASAHDAWCHASTHDAAPAPRHHNG